MVIMATVAINGVLGENGLINQTRKQKEESKEEIQAREEETNQVRTEYDETMRKQDKIIQTEWIQTISGSGEEKITDMIETSDGGYLVVGYSNSTDINWLPYNKGQSDAFIVKYDAKGERLWGATVGGSNEDWFSGVIENNGEYIAVGATLSETITTESGEKITRGAGSVAGIIAKYSKDGKEIFVKTAQNDAKSWDISDSQYEYSLFTDIAKTESGYAITGKLDCKDTQNTSYLTLSEYTNNDILSKKNKLWENHNSGTVTKYTDYNNNLGTARIEYNTLRYILYGNYTPSATGQGRVDRLYKTNLASEISKIQSEGQGTASRIYNLTTGVIYDINGKMIINSHNYLPSNATLTAGSICIIDETIETEADEHSNEKWIENGNYKDITQVSNTTFATIKTLTDTPDKTKLQIYSNNGNLLQEYDIPSYDKIYKVGVNETYILTGSPTDVEKININGNEDAIIGKYKLVDKK